MGNIYERYGRIMGKIEESQRREAYEMTPKGQMERSEREAAQARRAQLLERLGAQIILEPHPAGIVFGSVVRLPQIDE